MPETILSARDLVVSYGSHVVLAGASLVLHENERVGLVGRNGSGKSTFLRIAAGALEPDAGELVTRRDLITGYLPQVFDLAPEETVHANILAGAQRVLDLVREYENASAHAADSHRSAELLAAIEHADGWNLEHRARALITHLHAPDAERIVGTLSGGEKRRVALCRALLARPDFLILDEPTNHLDTESIEWLEDFLKKYPGACLFVTHDRYFLDRIATRIVELARGVFHSHEGNYTDFLVARAERAAVEQQQEKSRQKFLKNEIEWIRRAPRARRTKNQDRIDRYFETAAQSAPERELDVELLIPPPPKLANRVIELRDVAMDLGGRELFHGLNLALEPGMRLGIVGRNGLGKTTLLRVILGEIAPTRGEVERGARTEVNYIDQSRLALDEEKSVWEEVGGGSEHMRIGEETVTLRAYLRRYLFTDERINTKISQLSGGERSRVVLAKILKRGGNVLILDEPTNDLDLATLRILEEALIAFAGTGVVLVVSHDRWFLNRVCTGIIAFEGGGRVTVNAGNYDYFLEKKSARDAAQNSGNAPAKAADNLTPAPPAKLAGAKPRKLKWKEERELETMEAAVLTAEEEVARLEAQLASPDFYQMQRAQWPKVEAELNAARAKVAALYARWEELEKAKAAVA